uniref:Chromatin assembly factor 1 subunit A dimerization domain-containing protein n=1 Tax=Romanomermis culicivorax TaxID=13658 RepID=A0A915IP38_ROMCU
MAGHMATPPDLPPVIFSYISAKEKSDIVLSRHFMTKAGMSMAPIIRRQRFSIEERQSFENELSSQNKTHENLYLSEIKSGAHKITAECRNRKKRGAFYRCRKSPLIPDDIVQVDDNFQSVNIPMNEEQTDEIASKRILVAKLLQFTENWRPPYYGTWRKVCKKLNGRNPFLKAYEKFDYDVDSEADWEEEDPNGDECKSTEDETDINDEVDEEEGSFIVEHGYLSESEEEQMQNDLENEQHLDPETRRATMKIKAEAWKAEKMCKKWEKLKATCIINPAFHQEVVSLDSYIVDLFKSMEAIIVEPNLTSIFPPKTPSTSNNSDKEKSQSTKTKSRAKSKNKAQMQKQSPVIPKRNLMDSYFTSSPSPKMAKMDYHFHLNVRKKNAAVDDNQNLMTKVLSPKSASPEIVEEKSSANIENIVTNHDDDSV